jgi:hypothetical protein
MQTFPDNAPDDFVGDFMLENDETSYGTVKTLRSGRFGHFAANIGESAASADTANLYRLVKAFPELFFIAYEHYVLFNKAGD